MNKRLLALLFWYAALIIFVVLSVISPFLDVNLMDSHFWTVRSDLFLSLLLLLLLLTVLLAMLVQTVASWSTQKMRWGIRKILLHSGDLSLQMDDSLLQDVSSRIHHLTKQVQTIQNQELLNREGVIEEERRRIARDLHDTVSQELFAASMFLSGLQGQSPTRDQITLVKNMIETAQKDLRILLLQLRPTELKGRTLTEGVDLLLNEISQKSSLKVAFQSDIEILPTNIEEHLFRIIQEILSNTLRHSKAQHLDLYLLDRGSELQLKVIDDGVGFDRDQVDPMSYGLSNIEERVADMAGRIQIRTSPNKGVAIDIRVPLLKGEENNHEVTISR